MKKVQLATLATLFATLCAGCGGKTSSGVVSSTGGLSENHEPVTITYASWDLGSADSEKPNIDRMMIDEFEKEYPWITVEILERPKQQGTDADQDWAEFLTSRAAVKRLPDVFKSEDIPRDVTNNWAMNINSLVESDSEYAKLSEDVRNAAVYKGMTFALPTAIHYQGYVVNNSLFEKRNQDYQTPATEWTDFLTALGKAAKHEAGGNVAGIDGIEHIIHAYAGHLDTNLEWFAYDKAGNDGKGEFKLDGDAFKQTVEFYLSIYNNNKISYDNLKNVQIPEGEPSLLETYFGTGDPWDNEIMLARWFGTYSLGALQSQITLGERTSTYDFIGFPGVNGVKRTPITLDFNIVSSQTKAPEAAYLLAKWLGFGTAGYAKRFELSTNTDGLDPVNYAPLIADEALLDQFFALYPDFPGYREVVESQSFIAEPTKYMVGYNQVRYKGTYDSENSMFQIINEKLLKGQITYNTISAELNRRANAIYQETAASFESAINKYYIQAA